MEKISYEEAREWFWVRTLIWCFPAALASVAAHFFYSADLITAMHSRILFAVGVGVGVVLLGALSAFFSMQFPWMRTGRWYGFVLTGPGCAAAAAFVAFLIFGLVLAVLQDNTANPPSPDMIDMIYRRLVPFVIGAAGFWGFCFGSWFALRRDRYFVEQI